MCDTSEHLRLLSAGRPIRRRRKTCVFSNCIRRRVAALDRPDLARRLTVVPYPRRIPTVLSVEEVTLLLRAATAPKYKAAFATAYGAGLRVSEVVALKVGDIDSER